MRIIAGKYRGARLLSPLSDATRPTKDAIKEAVFSSLGYAVSGSSFLDLFGGSGAIGLEAASRGANKVVINDADSKAYQIINANIAKVKADAVSLCLDYKRCLISLEGQHFDYIYIDPPYAFSNYQGLLAMIADNSVLSENGTIILETARNCDLSDIDTAWQIVKEKNYGISKISYFKRKEQQYDKSDVSGNI